MSDFDIISKSIAAQRGAILNGFSAITGLDNIEKAGAGSRGGKIIGYTKSGKAIYDSHTEGKNKQKPRPEYADYTKQDHQDAQDAHNNALSNALKEHGTNSKGAINHYSADFDEMKHRKSENFHRSRANASDDVEKAELVDDDYFEKGGKKVPVGTKVTRKNGSVEEKTSSGWKVVKKESKTSENDTSSHKVKWEQNEDDPEQEFGEYDGHKFTIEDNPSKGTYNAYHEKGPLNNHIGEFKTKEDAKKGVENHYKKNLKEGQW